MAASIPRTDGRTNPRALSRLRADPGFRLARVPSVAQATSLTPLAIQLFPRQSPAPTPVSPDSDSPASDPEPEPTPTATEVRDAFVGALLPILLRTPVLRTLATLQRTLDALDVEGLTALWAARRPEGLKLGEDEEDPDMDEWTAVIDDYLARTSSSRSNGGGAEELEQTDAELRYRMAAYLLSASFKDCSVIVRMRPREGADEEVSGRVFVIDLDVKSIDRLSKWAKLDRQIVDAYRDMPPRDCVDGCR